MKGKRGREGTGAEGGKEEKDKVCARGGTTRTRQLLAKLSDHLVIVGEAASEGASPPSPAHLFLHLRRLSFPSASR